MNEDNLVFNYTQKVITQIVSENDKETIKCIKRYCEENNIFPNLVSEEKLKEILELGIKKDNLNKGIDELIKKYEDRIKLFDGCGNVQKLPIETVEDLKKLKGE